MAKPGNESLSQYVERVLREKHLSRHDVKLRSGGEITDSYVSAIISRSASNLSVEKLKALAAGLRVSEMEIIRVAFGLSNGRDPRRNIDRSHNLLLLDISKKTVIGSDVAEIVQEVLKLSAEHRAVVFQYVKRLGKSRRKTQRSSRSR